MMLSILAIQFICHINNDSDAMQIIYVLRKTFAVTNCTLQTAQCWHFDAVLHNDIASLLHTDDA